MTNSAPNPRSTYTGFVGRTYYLNGQIVFQPRTLSAGTGYTPVGNYSGAEPQLVNGAMVGMRSFTFNPRLQGLTGPLYTDHVYSEGENVAECKSPYSQMFSSHRIAHIDCTCGFYAYHNGDNDYDDHSTQAVTGVVRGYGKCTVGERGFRAEKLQIIALVDPTLDEPTPEVRLRTKVADRLVNYSEKKFVMKFVLTVLLSFLGLGLSVLLLMFTPIPEAVASVLYYLGWTAIFADMIGSIISGKRSLKQLERAKMGDSTVNWEHVHEAYPNVKYYKTVEQMLEAHPLTPQQPGE